MRIDAMDGPLGAYLREEMEAHGVHGFAVGAFDNGMRQVSITTRPVVVPADLIGIRMRTPDAPLIADTFRAFGAEPVTVNSADIYAALKSGKVDAQENPLALIELFKLYRGGPLHQRHQSHLVGIQRARSPADVEAPARRTSSTSSSATSRATRGSSGRSRPPLNARLRTTLAHRTRYSTTSTRRRSATARAGIREMEETARDAMLVAARGGDRATCLINLAG